MLNGRLSYYDVEDVESFCRSVLTEHLATGVRKASGGSTGPSSLADHDYEDALAYLVVEAWRASVKFDGRGRFSGYLVQRLHRRIVDWKRERFGSTRYASRPVIELTDQDRDLVAELTDLSGPEVLDLVNSAELTLRSRRTLERVVLPIVFEGRSVEDYAERSGKPVTQINREVAALRRELEQKELLAA
jgi:DNA-directed RNA polymerase specialized sigma24 family protein